MIAVCEKLSVLYKNPKNYNSGGILKNFERTKIFAIYILSRNNITVIIKSSISGIKTAQKYI